MEKRKINASFVIFLIIFILLITIPLTIIIKSIVNPDKIPDVFGYKPFIVINDTNTKVKKGDLILTKVIKEDEIKVGEIFAYKSEESITVNEVVEILEEEGQKYLVIKILDGNRQDYYKVSTEYVEGEYLFRIPYLGGLLERANNIFVINLVIAIIIGIAVYVVSNKEKNI